jgi:hypothetical protein
MVTIDPPQLPLQDVAVAVPPVVAVVDRVVPILVS